MLLGVVNSVQTLDTFYMCFIDIFVFATREIRQTLTSPWLLAPRAASGGGGGHCCCVQSHTHTRTCTHTCSVCIIMSLCGIKAKNAAWACFTLCWYEVLERERKHWTLFNVDIYEKADSAPGIDNSCDRMRKHLFSCAIHTTIGFI